MISLLVPTRGRPHNIARLLGSLDSTTTGEIEVVWCVDDDDTPSVRALADQTYGPVVVGPRECPNQLWNTAWVGAKGDILAPIGDDIVFRTPGWDVMVEAAFRSVPDRLVLVYGRDGFRNQVHASHPFLSREWCEVLGYLYPHPEVFTQDMVDVWVFELAQAVNRTIYLPELFTQHMHPDDPSLGVEFDQTYRDNAMRRERDRTHERYADYAAERAADVEKLRRALR